MPAARTTLATLALTSAAAAQTVVDLSQHYYEHFEQPQALSVYHETGVFGSAKLDDVALSMPTNIPNLLNRFDLAGGITGQSGVVNGLTGAEYCDGKLYGADITGNISQFGTSSVITLGNIQNVESLAMIDRGDGQRIAIVSARRDGDPYLVFADFDTSAELAAIPTPTLYSAMDFLEQFPPPTNRLLVANAGNNLGFLIDLGEDLTNPSLNVVETFNYSLGAGNITGLQVVTEGDKHTLYATDIDSVACATIPLPPVLPCPPDLNPDAAVDSSDLAQLLAAWNTPAADLNADGTTNSADLATLLAAWGPCP